MSYVSSNAEPGSSGGWPRWCRRVLFVSHRYPDVSGGSRYIDNLGSALERQRVEVSVLSIYQGSGSMPFATTTLIKRETLHRRPVLRGEKTAIARMYGLTVLLFKRVDRARFRRRYRAVIDGLSPDDLVIFTHANAKLVLDEAGYRQSRSSPIFVGQHHSAFESIEHEPTLEQRIRRAFDSVDAFTGLSSTDAAQFQNLLPVPCFGVPNPSASPTAPPPGTVPLETKVVALARLSPEKQLDVMVRAFATATSAPGLGNWRLEIYGEGSQRAALESLIREIGAGDRVRLAGVTTKPEEVLRSAELNLLTSRYEGFGYAVLEAAQQAVPSLAFDCSPGLRELMAATGGRLVPPAAGEDGYARALQEMLSDPVALRRRGAEAQSGAARYSPDNVLDAWRLLLNAVHDERRTKSEPL